LASVLLSMAVLWSCQAISELSCNHHNPPAMLFTPQKKNNTV